MESSNHQIHQVPFSPTLQTSSMSKVTGFFSNKKNIVIVVVVLTGCLFIAYKMKYLNFLLKKKIKIINLKKQKKKLI